MTSAAVDKIARAVLYEGYLLYPYRHSALKNQHRWNFGVLYPPAWAARQTGSDRSYFQMACVARATPESRLDVSVRFLQLVEREKAIEQSSSVYPLLLSELAARPHIEAVSLPGSVEGQIEISTAPIRDDIFRLTVQFRNTTRCVTEKRDVALLHSFVSAHAVLHLWNGEFVSQIDPPEELRDPVAACQNTGVWPVLVGEGGSRDTMLGSPIILYDYPQIAPESKGDLFDGTEIDEILTLRILTLTDEEKAEMRHADERARRILDRLETSPSEHLLELHGAMRSLQQRQDDAWSAWETLEGSTVGSAAVSGVDLKKGDRVRLRPRKRADIFDTLLEGKIAVVEAVEEDFEGNMHFAVVLEDDPGRDLGEIRQAGHRFFFSTEELEPVRSSSTESLE
jgi:hypothetical protein